MRRHSREEKSMAKLVGIISISLLLVETSCGDQDYQQPIQQFQQASAAVIKSTGDFLQHMNQIEQNNAIDRAAIDRQPINLQAIRQKTEIITSNEIAVRQKALDAISSYCANLAKLAQGKNGQTQSSTGHAVSGNSSDLSGVANKAKVLPSKSPAHPVDNAKLSDAANVAAAAVKLIGQEIEDRKARREIQDAVIKAEGPVNDLLAAVENDVNAAYDRQMSALGDWGIQIAKAYENEREKGDPAALLYLSEQLKAYNSRLAILQAANPGPAISAMKDAHNKLVGYVSSPKPETLGDLVNSAKAFFTTAEPLATATVNLLKAQ
jgi:hypothetical protein